MAETRSSARIRMLMSSSLTLDRIISWYSATSSGCVGTILTIASSAMYFTAIVNHLAVRRSIDHSARTYSSDPGLAESRLVL